MKRELSALQPQLIEAAKATDAVMAIIEKESAEVANKSELVKEDEAKANVQAEEASKLKGECLEDLADALPLLESKICTFTSPEMFHSSQFASQVTDPIL
jgi:dynein heavy chain